MFVTLLPLRGLALPKFWGVLNSPVSLAQDHRLEISVFDFLPSKFSIPC